MKKKLILIVGIIVLLLIAFIIVWKYYQGKKYVAPFYVEQEYYNEGKFIDVNALKVNEMLNDKKSFLLYSYNNYCSLPIPCEDIFKEIATKYRIDVLKLPFAGLKETSLYDDIKLAPSFIIIKEGKIVSYLHADKDSDIDRYQNAKVFEQWLKQYVILKK